MICTFLLNLELIPKLLNRLHISLLFILLDLKQKQYFIQVHRTMLNKSLELQHFYSRIQGLNLAYYHKVTIFTSFNFSVNPLMSFSESFCYNSFNLLISSLDYLSFKIIFYKVSKKASSLVLSGIPENPSIPFPSTIIITVGTF